MNTKPNSNANTNSNSNSNFNLSPNANTCTNTNSNKSYDAYLKQNSTRVLIESHKKMQDWFRLEMMNAVKLNTNVEERQLSDTDEQLLDKLSLRGKAIMGRPITMGTYSQGVNGEIAPIEWLPIAVKKDRVQLISRYSIDYVEAFDSEHEEQLWKDSELRSWLNSEFLEKSFTEEERSILIKDELNDCVGLPAIDMIREINYSSNLGIIEPTAYADKKWQAELEQILVEAGVNVDRDRYESYHRQFKNHYCGLDTDKLGNSFIIAMSEENPERVKALELKSMSLRPVVWVKAR